MSTPAPEIAQRPLFQSLHWDLWRSTVQNSAGKESECAFRQVLRLRPTPCSNSQLNDQQSVLLCLEQRARELSIHKEFGAWGLQNLPRFSHTYVATRTDALLVHSHVLRLTDSLLLLDPPPFRPPCAPVVPAVNTHEGVHGVIDTIADIYATTTTFRSNLHSLSLLLSATPPLSHTDQATGATQQELAVAAIKAGYRQYVPGVYNHEFLLRVTVYADLLRTYLVRFLIT